ncbi:MAG: C69 family dipeptidase [Candidatus Bipolaricaulia bacterium]
MGTQMNRGSRVRRCLPACTTMIVGREATVDGSVIVSHSDDDVADERLAFVPAADWPTSAKRPVYYDDCSIGHDPRYNSTELRRYVGTSRGPDYDTKDYPDSIPLGKIDQVDHTFAYFDSNYGVMNERQLMIGECTCGAKVHPTPKPDRRIFYAAELSRVALERCVTAVEAITLMGNLIKDHGLYGTGETLLVGDKTEGWVMEMCGYDEDEEYGQDGIWVAQRVPDADYFVAANQFRIRDVDPESDDFMCSENLFRVCEEKGWWSPKRGKPLDWLKAVSWGEYGHPYYSLRRVWRALSKVAPELNLPAWVGSGYTRAYPFSATPKRKLSVADVIDVYRDHYEGTELDLTKGVGAGPYGDPTRYEGNVDRGLGDDDNSVLTEKTSWNLAHFHPEGAWERAISIFRSGMMWINQARDDLPDAIGGVSWVGLDRPAANCLMPFFVGVRDLPRPMKTMKLTEFEFESDSAWWAFNYVANYATMRYAFMIQDIRLKQREQEDAAYDRINALQRLAGGSEDPSPADLYAACEEIMKKTLAAWWELAKSLVVKYNDGCHTEAGTDTQPEKVMEHMGYPTKAWLKAVGFYDGPTQY